MCDTEASVYCPLLEETSFIPTHKYAYGNEIREHAERVVRQWKLEDSGVFRTKILEASWDDERKRWAVTMETDHGPGSQVSFIYTHTFHLLASTSNPVTSTLTDS